MRIPIAAALALTLPAPAPFAQEPKPAPKPAAAAPDSLEEEFHRAFYLENGLRDFAKAAEAYAKVAEGAAAPERRALRVRALLGRGRCLATAGRLEEAKSVFAKVLEIDSGNEDAKRGTAAADGGPGDLDAELREMIEGYVGDIQDSASRQNLARIGSPAVPFIEKALRQIDVGAVDAAAKLLATMDAPGARAALARAMNDPAVRFPDVVDKALDQLTNGDTDTDGEGRIRIFEAALACRDDRRRDRRIQTIVGQNIPLRGMAEAADLLAAFLARASDAQRHGVTRTDWPHEMRRRLVPAALPLLESRDEDIRRWALGIFAYAKELTGEQAKALDSLLESPEAWERFEAWKVLESHGRLEEPRRGSVFCAFLSGAHPDQLHPALQWIESGYNNVPFRWSDSFAPGFVEGLKRTLDLPASDIVLQLYQRILPKVANAIGNDALVDLAARGLPASPQNSKYNLGIAAADAVVARLANEPTREAVNGAFLRGFRALPRSVRYAWVSRWNNLRGSLETEALQEVAGSPETSGYGLQWIVELGEARPPATPAMLEQIAQRLLHADVNVSGTARRALALYDSPALVPAIRALLGRYTDPYGNETVQLRAALVRCLGREAAADLRAMLEANWARRSPQRPFDPVFMLRELVDCAGKDAVPDLREWLRRTRSVQVRDMLVKAIGIEAVPDLVEMAAEPGGAIQAVSDQRSGVHRVSIPVEVFEAFLQRLPAEHRSGSLIKWTLGSASPGTRSRIIEESLRSPDPDVASAAAAAVRQFQMADRAPLLVALLDSEHEIVRKEAAESLESIRRYRELKATFGSGAEDPGRKATEDALAMARSPDAAKRRGAALALGALGDRSAVATLLKLVDDSDASVRDAALAALERLGGRKPAEAPKEGGN